MRMGQGAVGGSNLDPQSVIHYDSRRHAGPGDPILVNYGSGGPAFDLNVIEYDPGSYWALKTLNWGSTGTIGNGIYPSTWDDFGGHPLTAPFFFATHLPTSFTGQEDMYTENEWYINCDSGPSRIGFAGGNYIDYFDGTDVVDGFTTLALGCNYELMQEFYVGDFGTRGATRRSSYQDCLVAHYIDIVGRNHRFWIYDGLSMYSFEHTFTSNGSINEDATYEWLFIDDQSGGTFPATSGVDDMFWSFSYHQYGLWGALPGYGTPWGHCTGQTLTRPTTAQMADLDQYVKDWWLYYSSDLDDIDILNP